MDHSSCAPWRGDEDVYGPLWLFAVVYSQILVVAGSAQLAAAALRWRRPGQVPRRVALGLTPLLPLLANAVYLSGIMGWSVDPTPLLTVGAMLALRGAIFRGGLLEPLPVSPREFVHQLPLGIVLTDPAGAVVELNDVAAARLGVFERDALGSRLADLARGTVLRRAPLTRWRRRTGEIVLLK